MTKSELKEFLDAKAEQYEHPQFLEQDPLQVPHRFTQKEDIEISAFLTATIAWGNRKSIINNALLMMELMDNTPYDFVMHHQNQDLDVFQRFVHRTFNAGDLAYFIQALKNIYTRHGGLERIFHEHQTTSGLQPAIHQLKGIFFELEHLQRTKKHISDPQTGSAAKRINMFLRWMVRSSEKGVDFNLWKTISPAQLSCPLDVHSGNVARKLRLLQRKQNDAKAVAELDNSLRKMDATDPVRYDFALFGLGVFEKF